VHIHWIIIITNGQRILIKGHIIVLSPLAAANGFVRPWPRSNTCLTGPIWVKSIKRHLSRFSHFCVHHCKGSQCFLMRWKTQKLPLPLADQGSHLIHGSLSPLESPTKRHVDRFSCFYRVHEYDQQTDHATPCVAIGHYR